MPSYNAPGVYIQDVVSGTQTIDQLSSSVGMLIGVAKSGLVNVAQKIGSWTEYIEKYANGLETPFDANNYLPYAVYGFFQNGGKELYVGNVKKNAQKATGTASTSKIVATALYEGVWGNELKVTIAKNSAWSNDNKVYDVTVVLGTSASVTVSEVTYAECVSVLNENETLKKWMTFA